MSQVGYKFYKGADSFGLDIGFVGERTIEELMRMADSDDRCIAFNSLGFLKYAVTLPGEFIVLPNRRSERDGLYIKQSFIESIKNTTKYDMIDNCDYTKTCYEEYRVAEPMNNVITVRPLCNWTSTEQFIRDIQRFCDRPNGWKNMVFTNSEGADYNLIINYPSTRKQLDPYNTVLFQMEPMRLDQPGNFGVKSWNRWLNPDRHTDRPFLYVGRHSNSLNNLEWHLGMTYNELLGSIDNIPKNDKKVAIVMSDKNYDKGHMFRISLVKRFEELDNNFIDIYGMCRSLNFSGYKGELPPYNKNDGILPYKYTIACENTCETNYITEKIVDCILGETLCFSSGCPNIEQYLDARAYIRLTDNHDYNYKLIKTAIENDEWSKRIDIIRMVKRDIVTKLSFMPRLNNILNSDYELATYCINLKRRPDRKKMMEEQLVKTGMYNCEFIEAVDGKELKSDNVLLKMFEGNDFNSLRGAVGCALSHYNIWQKILEDKSHKQVFLILEDDTVLAQNFREKIIRVIQQTKENGLEWDSIYLGYHMRHYNRAMKPCEPNKLEHDLRIIPLNYGKTVGGTFAFLINRSFCRKMLDFIHRVGIKHGIDYLINRYAKDIGINQYELVEDIAYSDWVQSNNSQVDTDIQNDHNSIVYKEAN